MQPDRHPAQPTAGTAPAPAHASPSGRQRGLWWLVAGVVAVHLGLLGMWLQGGDMGLVRSKTTQTKAEQPQTVTGTPAQTLQLATPHTPATQPAATPRGNAASSQAPQARAERRAQAQPPTSQPLAGGGELKNKQKDPSALVNKDVNAIHSEAQPRELTSPAPPENAAKPAVEATALQAASAPAPQETRPDAGTETGTAATKAPPRPAPALWTGALRVPASAELRYDVKASRKGLSMGAQSTLSWVNDGSSYRAKLEVKAFLAGSRTQTSVGRIDPALGLQPERFGDRNKQEQATHFDRTQAVPAIRFSNNAADEPLYPQTQDRLSVLLQLAAMAAGDAKRFQQGRTISIHTANSRDADIWRFVVGPTETLELPVGSLAAVHLVRAPQQAFDNKVEVWLAPSMGHLPVRILWTQANGDVVDQRLASHSP